MFQVIKSDDIKVLSSSRFVKNATFYKDMFAFFDAYEKLTTDHKKSLPNFCFVNKKEFCLEGLCLVMRMYASELGFETLKLTADYLRVLYFTICAYSTDKKTVEREAIEVEFEEYKKASKQVVDASEKEVSDKEAVYFAKKQKYDQGANKYARKLVGSQVFNILFVVSLILGTAATLFLSIFLGIGSGDFALNIDVFGIIIFIVVVAISLLYKQAKGKKPSPILMIAISACLGMIFYSI